MAQAMVHQSINFTRSDLNAAINNALAAVANDAAWTRAIYRAAANLAAGQFSYDGQQVILRSASSNRVYRITTNEPMSCTCEGRAKGYTCWHIAAGRLIVRAAERHAAQAAPRAVTSMAELQAAADELFA